MPELSMISPAGFVADVNYGTFPPTFNVYRPLAGTLVTAKNTGLYPIARFFGRQGTILASIKAGAAGSTRALAFLVGKWPSPTKYIGIALDSTNRPFAKLSVDGQGTVSGQSSPNGPAIPSGYPVNVRLVFNALGPIHNGFEVAFLVEDVLQGVWTINPVSTWVPFAPTALVVGAAPVGGMTVSNGTILYVQVSDGIDIPFVRDIPEAEEESVFSALTAGSSLVAATSVVFDETSSVVANSSVSAGISVILDETSAVTADSSVAAEITIT